MQALENAYQRAPRISPMDKAALADLQSIPAAHEQLWYRALSIYHRNYAHSDFVFDDALRLSDETLSYWSASAATAPAKLPSDMAQALNLVAPLYAASLWPKHRAQNDAFARNLHALLTTYGATFRSRLPELYGTPWLSQPYHVDVTAYADRDGSYCNSASNFVHIVMSSSDSNEGGQQGLDVLFHEASHWIADPFEGTIGGPIVAATTRLDRLVPDQFWHAILIYTPGHDRDESQKTFLTHRIFVRTRWCGSGTGCSLTRGRVTTP